MFSIFSLSWWYGFSYFVIWLPLNQIWPIYFFIFVSPNSSKILVLSRVVFSLLLGFFRKYCCYIFHMFPFGSEIVFLLLYIFFHKWFLLCLRMNHFLIYIFYNKFECNIVIMYYYLFRIYYFFYIFCILINLSNFLNNTHSLFLIIRFILCFFSILPQKYIYIYKSKSINIKIYCATYFPFLI